jgi:hypothetical protein
MKRDTKMIGMVAVGTVALLLVSSLLPQEYKIEYCDLLEEQVIEWNNGTPVEGSQPESPEGEGYNETMVGPEVIGFGLVEIKDQEDLEKLKRLAELEGKQEFKNIMPTSYYGRHGLAAECDGLSLKNAEATFSEDLGPTTTAPPERDIEEADLVKLVGDRLYILNPYRGLIIVDVSQPASPKVLGRANIIGTPVEMYIVDEMAYVITSTNFQYWYDFGVISLTSMVVDEQEPPAFRIGSQVQVVDLSNPSCPEEVGHVYLEGFITDSRRVGEVIYFVSSCYEWYTTYGVNGSIDQSFILSLNLADPSGIHSVDKISFPGGSNSIHVSTQSIYVAQPYNVGSSRGYTDITLVDITDPDGDIEIKDMFQLDGSVEDRFQMDHYAGMFRVVSHFPPRGLGASDLWVFDVSNPDDVTKLGRLRIDDAGDLMATRFAGERAYTIHFPRRLPTSVDPLDVIDLSDPTNPILCDVLEIPGWVTHMEVRGMNIIAMGVDDNRSPAVTLFDVTDPWNAVDVDRVHIGEGRSWSEANIDPKAFTVLDEQRLVVVPFSYNYKGVNEHGYRERIQVDGVQLVEFDLLENDLRLGEWFEQEDPVTRTRGLGDYILATSPRFLQVADVSDIDAPEVQATVELCPYVVDVRVFEDFVAQIHRSSLDNRLILRISSHPSIDLGNFLAEMPLDERVMSWYWNGRYLHLFWTRTDQNDVSWATLTTIDITNPYMPYEAGGCTFSIPSEDIPSKNTNRNYYYDDIILCGIVRYPGYSDSHSFDNPILVDGRLFVLFVEGRLYSIDLRVRGSPTVASVVSVDCDPVLDFRVAGRIVYLTDTKKYEHILDLSNREYYKYFLQRIDLTDPSMPLRLPEVNIPGVPLGTDDTGVFLFTKASWWLGEDDGFTTTLNVVNLGLGVATLRSAFELGSYSDLVIEGDKAIIVRTGSYYGGYYNYDYYSSSRYNTTVEVIDLLGGSGPRLTTSLEIGTRCYSFKVEGGHIFMNPAGDDGLMVYRVEDEGSLTTVGFFAVRPEYSSVLVEDGCAYLMQGMYGFNILELNRD